MKNNRLRNTFISLFVILWLLAFNYESVRYFYLNPLAGRELPKIKFLFPPAGWIMFFNVDDRFGLIEVYGLKKGVPYLFDPHQIFETRFIGFDNLHRGVLGAAKDHPHAFCRFMERKFPNFDDFAVTIISYPSLIKQPQTINRYQVYQCAYLSASEIVR
jgi:hypothetical protein